MIEISIDENSGNYLLLGSITEISKNRRAKYYFQDFLGAKFEEDRILIPFNEENKESVLKDIDDSLEDYGLQISESQTIRDQMDSYYREKQAFIEFSEKAKGIWNNEFDKELFREFSSALKTNLKRRLYDKQFLAAFHLAFAQNACNFSVPGAGKTSVVYGAYAYLKNLPFENDKHVNKLLVVGPLSSFGPWENEYAECFGIPANAQRLSGGLSREDRDHHLLTTLAPEESPEILLMSYQSLSYNLDSLRAYLSHLDHKVMVVLDEAHKIKNTEGGVWAQSALSIASLCKARVVLTGTPVPNGYEDIFNLYEFIWPGKEIIDFNVFQLKDMSMTLGDSRVPKLIDQVSPFFIRIKKSDLGLPPTVNKPPIKVPMGNVQRELYEFIENQYIPYFEQFDVQTSFSAKLVQARFIRLMQSATNPGLLRKPLEQYFSDQGMSNDLYIDDTEIVEKILQYKDLETPQKFIVAKDLISSLVAKGEKVIVWATFIQTVKEFQVFLAENEILSEILIGEVPVESDAIAPEVITREKIIDAFHLEDSPFNVLIANPFAVAESISLHKPCHNAIYLERTFNSANFIQSKDRIHRYGLPEGTTTTYYYILSENSIDETIHRRLIEKERRMLELIESQEIPLITENLNYDLDLENDVKAIIRDYVRRVAKTS